MKRYVKQMRKLMRIQEFFAFGGAKMTRCAVVCAASLNEQHVLKMQQGQGFEAILAVDGGYERLRSCGLKPTLVLGDFDSLGFVPTDIPVLRFPEDKNESDLGLALTWAGEQGFDDVYVYGAFSGRIDHTIAALQELARAAERFGHTRFLGVSECNSFVVLCSGQRLCIAPEAQTGALSQHNKDARSVSVLSLCDVSRGVNIAGLKYELSGAELRNRGSLGLSNEYTGKAAEISVQHGTILVVLPL